LLRFVLERGSAGVFPKWTSKFWIFRCATGKVQAKFLPLCCSLYQILLAGFNQLFNQPSTIKMRVVLVSGGVISGVGKGKFPYLVHW